MRWPATLIDFRARLMVALGLLAICTITPMMALRFISHETTRGFMDAGIVAAIMLCTAYLMAGGTLQYAITAAAIACSAGVVGVSFLDIEAGTRWAYPVVIANFMLVPRRQALALAVAIVAMTQFAAAQPGFFQRLTFAITALVTSLFGYFFAWQSEQRQQALERITLEDPLTGLSNRRALVQHLEDVVKAKHGFGLAIVDVDHFKRVNDTLGHAGGDELLLQLADLLRSHLRSGDDVYRYGGEEFLLALPEVGEAMQQRMEELRLAAERTLRAGGQPVTVSIGATMLAEGDTGRACFDRADAALYAAKNGGRNRVVMG